MAKDLRNSFARSQSSPIKSMQTAYKSLTIELYATVNPSLAAAIPRTNPISTQIARSAFRTPISPIWTIERIMFKESRKLARSRLCSAGLFFGWISLLSIFEGMLSPVFLLSSRSRQWIIISVKPWSSSGLVVVQQATPMIVCVA